MGLSGARIVTDTQDLPASIDTLTIETGDVPMSVRLITDPEATKTRISLRIITRSDTQLNIADHDSGESRVTLSHAGDGFLGFRGKGEIEVVLPPALARRLSVTVNQRAGSLTSEATLDRLVATIDNGAATVGGAARVVNLNIRHGDVNTSDEFVVSESFEARTESGSISVRFRQAPRIAEATAEGNVTMQLPDSNRYRVRAGSAAPGRAPLVTVRQTSDRNAPEVIARSENGRVEVTQLP
ncbi:hypothetical protein M4D79_04565 [Mycolicibacterium novocastrense]|nr:hypothetical protein M4D79_04565 [Mycolicibacterium novocastrense]